MTIDKRRQCVQELERLRAFALRLEPTLGRCALIEAADDYTERLPSTGSLDNY